MNTHVAAPRKAQSDKPKSERPMPILRAMTVPLDQITHGDKINSRKTGRADGIEALADDMSAHGNIEPIVVRDAPYAKDLLEVVVGNRRLSAFLLLAERGRIARDELINVMYLDADDFEAFEASVAENYQRLPPPPIDQYEAFARVQREQGLTPSEIALRFGASELHVRKMLALGDLPDKILNAWRTGNLRDDSVQAFTLARDNPAQQLRVFEKLSKARNLWAQAIRSELGAADRDLSAAIKAVGIDAYAAAGGSVVIDLFGESDVVSDPALLKKMAVDLITAKCDALKADGWAWAIDKAAAQGAWNWRQAPGRRPALTTDEKSELERVEKTVAKYAAKNSRDGKPLSAKNHEEYDTARRRLAEINDGIESRSYSAKAKRGLGCFVQISHAGALTVDYGRERPEDTKASEKAKKKASASNGVAPEEPPASISNAMARALSEQLTAAVRDTLAVSPRCALVAAIATLEQQIGHSGPLRLNTNGMSARSHLSGFVPGDDDEASEEAVETFGSRLASMNEAPIEWLLERFAAAVAHGADLRTFNAGSKSQNNDDLLTLLPQTLFDEKAKFFFDADGYFKGVSAKVCTEALIEMNGRNTFIGKGKADLAGLCASEARRTGWVPAQLRVPGAPQTHGA